MTPRPPQDEPVLDAMLNVRLARIPTTVTIREGLTVTGTSLDVSAHGPIGV